MIAFAPRLLLIKPQRRDAATISPLLPALLGLTLPNADHVPLRCLKHTCHPHSAYLPYFNGFTCNLKASLRHLRQTLSPVKPVSQRGRARRGRSFLHMHISRLRSARLPHSLLNGCLNLLSALKTFSFPLPTSLLPPSPTTIPL